jgi:protein SCO1/2
VTAPALTRRQALFAMALAAGLPLPALAAAVALPGNSVYRLQAHLMDQDGREFDWDSLRGSPVLVSMFYGSCQMVCPMIFETVHLTLRALSEADRRDLRVLMITFDPARDTVAALKKTALARDCDARWSLARPDEATARKIAAVLGVQYRRLADGEFNHSTQVALLDREGRISARSGKLGAVDPALVKAVHGLPPAAS